MSGTSVSLKDAMIILSLAEYHVTFSHLVGIPRRGAGHVESGESTEKKAV